MLIGSLSILSLSTLSSLLLCCVVIGASQGCGTAVEDVSRIDSRVHVVCAFPGFGGSPLRMNVPHTRKAPLVARCFTSFPIQLTNFPPPPQPRLEKAKANCRVRSAFLMNDLFVAVVTVTAGKVRIEVDILPSP